MKLSEYQRATADTESVPGDLIEQQKIWRHGLEGELGSIHSVFKKFKRDGQAYSKFEDHVAEEIGDVLWYVGALARQSGVVLPDLLEPVERDDIDSLLFRLSHSCIRLGSLFGIEPRVQADVEGAFFATIQMLAAVSEAFGQNLGDIAQANVEKVHRRWRAQPNSPAPQFDSEFDDFERLPRELLIEFREKKTERGGIVILRVNDINIGDRITDNAHVEDGYRFHDAFHLAYAAVLGWSPVMRSLFRCKRKSDKRKDEVEDGGRASVIEEAISFQVYDYARELSFLESVTRVDQGLLSRITALVHGLEVSACAPWEWELAILRGYEVFRALRERGGGKVRLAASQRILALVD